MNLMQTEQELYNQVTSYVKENIINFHRNRTNRLETLKLKKILKKKNPYLFRAKYHITAYDIVKNLTDAFISSAEETIFGNWLEGLAIFVCSKVYGGKKSTIKGIDLEFNKDETRYIVAIKSGPNWGNSSQIEKMRSDFKTAQRTIRTGNSNIVIQAINGCCYGMNTNSDKGDYFKYCGQDFWFFISGYKSLYIDIIEPLATNAKERNEEFQKNYSKMLNKFTGEFITDFCFEDGGIDWEKLVKFNSASKLLL
ncbi:hypothetical protein EZS27_012385 [termite gut metagenome]|uniref:Type II restriction endonuclease EcoO109IR domain-containing protein n=1 Tax=termite gut metagenome TaxID=433724 RepID=A0A5J4S3D7_9ZZZZ